VKTTSQVDADRVVTFLQTIQLQAMPLARSIATELQCILMEAKAKLDVTFSHKQQHTSIHHDTADADANTTDSDSVIDDIMLWETTARASLYYSQLRSICSSINSLLTYHGINSITNQYLSVTLSGKDPFINKAIIPEFNYKFINKMIKNDADEVEFMTLTRHSSMMFI